MWRVCGSAIVVTSALFATVNTAMASGPIKLCIPEKEGGAIVTSRHGKCSKGYKLASLGAEGTEGREGKAEKEGRENKERPEGGAGFTPEQRQTMQKLLPHIKYIASGVGGKSTIQFSGVNIQVVNGEGSTDTINGEGNLVIGYDESRRAGNPGAPGAQTGSHNLILGQEQEFTSYGGLLVGEDNTISAPFASVSGGLGNTASGEDASVSGGLYSRASGRNASLGGGVSNTASGEGASVSGGTFNVATGQDASVSGGDGNTASGLVTSVSGGGRNTASSTEDSLGGASVQGGWEDLAEGEFASVFGGTKLKATNGYEAIP
jgi:hypothetical protein